MDTDALDIIRKVWRHSNVKGYVWMPHIAKIGQPGERFFENPSIATPQGALPKVRDDVDWYWTPGVSAADSRKAGDFPAQRALWVDCDDGYDDHMLTAMKPSYLWETSPGHKQAVWLLKDPVPAEEYKRDGLQGLLTQALGADKSGVDIGQLLRVPGSMHHKREPFRGQVLRATGTVYGRGQLTTRLARELGFPPGLASELGAEDPYGDRSKVIWRIARSAAELGLDQGLTFKLLKATRWNKWADAPELLKENIANAYAAQPTEATPDPEQQQTQEHLEESDEVVEPWSMATVEQFGPVLRRPISWVLPNIIPEAGCGLLVSAPKVGKTRVAIEIALGLATGRAPLGLTVGRKQGVGFFSLEDGEYLFSKRLAEGIDDGPNRRQQFHWDGYLDPKLRQWFPPKPMPLYTNFAQVDLSDAVDQQRLYETILRYDLRLAIIDTLSMAIGKSDVSQSKDMYAILKVVKEIAKGTGCAIMFIHHTRKRVFEKGESIQEMVLGSTALHAWSDYLMNLVAPQEQDGQLRLAVQTKMGSDVHHLTGALQIARERLFAEPEDVS